MDSYKMFQYVGSQERGPSWVQSDFGDEDLRPSSGHADPGIDTEALCTDFP